MLMFLRAHYDIQGQYFPTLSMEISKTPIRFMFLKAVSNNLLLNQTSNKLFIEISRIILYRRLSSLD